MLGGNEKKTEKNITNTIARDEKIATLNPARDISDLHELHLAIFRLQFVQWSLILLSLSEQRATLLHIECEWVSVAMHSCNFSFFFCQSLFWSQVQILFSHTHTSRTIWAFFFSMENYIFSFLNKTRIEPRSSLDYCRRKSYLEPVDSSYFSMGIWEVFAHVLQLHLHLRWLEDEKKCKLKLIKHTCRCLWQ